MAAHLLSNRTDLLTALGAGDDDRPAQPPDYKDLVRFYGDLD